MGHTSNLFDCHTLEDVKFEKWSEQRLDRLLVDYMLRKGMTESSMQLGKRKQIEVRSLFGMLTTGSCRR